jgi:hypothetical protein
MGCQLLCIFISRVVYTACTLSVINKDASLLVGGGTLRNIYTDKVQA